MDAIPSPVFVVDDEYRVRDLNRAASQWVGEPSEVLLQKLCGEVLHCINAQEASGGCGTTEACKDCVFRTSVAQTIEGKRVVRRKTRLSRTRDAGPEQIHVLVTASPFQHDEGTYALLILEDITELAELRSILPICSHCKKIRSDDEYWEHVESYLRRHMDVDLSHGLCPECVRKLYPGLGDPP